MKHHKFIPSLHIRSIIILSFIVISGISSAEQTPINSRNALTTSPKAYEALGNTFAKAIKKKDTDTLVQLFDMKRFANIAARTVFDSKNNIDQFVTGILRNKEENFLNQIFSAVFRTNANVKFLRVLKGKRPLIRIDYPEGGHEYVILYTKKLSDNKLSVVDMLFLSSGKKLSLSLGSASQLLLRPSKSVLKKLFGKNEVDEKLLKSFKEITRLRKSNQHKDAYNLIGSLPDTVKNQRVLIDLSIQLAQLINDDEYRKQLSRLDKYYGKDETTTFILIDHHYFNKNYDKAIVSVNRLIDIYGEDGALLNLISGTYHIANDNVNAKLFARKAIKSEPQFEDAYWTLVTVLLATQEFRDVIQTLNMLEKKFDYAFTAEVFQGNEVYQDFVKSSEFKAQFL